MAATVTLARRHLRPVSGVVNRIRSGRLFDTKQFNRVVVVVVAAAVAVHKGYLPLALAHTFTEYSHSLHLVIMF